MTTHLAREERMSVITLPNGIVLDSIGPEPLFAARSASDYAHHLGLESVKVYLATHPNEKREYLVVAQDENGTIPVYESNSLEEICCHLDMMKLAQEFWNEERNE